MKCWDVLTLPYVNSLSNSRQLRVQASVKVDKPIGTQKPFTQKIF